MEATLNTEETFIEGTEPRPSNEHSNHQGAKDGRAPSLDSCASSSYRFWSKAEHSPSRILKSEANPDEHKGPFSSSPHK